MAEFLTFPKMPCSGASDGPVWVALEKIHGAQLVVDVDADGVRFGKRKSWLGDEDPFFGWQVLRGALRDLARTAFAHVGVPRLILYGELFGGAYPHPAVTDRGLTAVQTGIWYAPDLRWAAFEARAVSTGRDEFLSWSELSDLGLPTPPLLARGRKVEIDRVSERFPSRVAESLGFPPLGPSNLAEGVVVKPDVRMPAASYTASKRKISEFREDRFDESQPWDPSKTLTFEQLAGWARAMTNGPRVASAASKTGRHDATALADEVVLDVMTDLEEAFPGAMAAVDAEAWSRLEQVIRAAIPP